MKFISGGLVIVLCAAGAGPATAAIILGNTQGGSSLFLSVWDTTRNVSYIRNLGYTLNTFLPTGFTTLPRDGGDPFGSPATGDKTPATGINLSFPAGDQLFATTFAASNAASIRWNIVAYDNLSNDVAGLGRAITTAVPTPRPTNANIDNIGVAGSNYLGALLSDTNLATQNAVAVANPNSLSFAGNANWASGLNNGGLESAATGFSDSIGFYYLARTTPMGLNDASATVLRYGNDGQFARWSLAADGTATYSLSAVPLPASAWLFVAGLGAFVGLARRSQAAKNRAQA